MSEWVYVLETGCYEDSRIHGVYATPEAAMAAWTPAPGAKRGHEYGSLAGQSWSYAWTAGEGGETWDFGADWDDAASITAYVVAGGPGDTT